MAFNAWQLGASPDGAPHPAGAAPPPPLQLQLKPAAAPRDAVSDFWTAAVSVPEGAYELNFVFSDGGSTYDNNEVCSL